MARSSGSKIKGNKDEGNKDEGNEGAEGEGGDEGAEGKRAKAPARFTVDASRQMGAGWAIKKAGAVITGRLIKRVAPKSEDSTGYYQIRLDDGPVKAADPDDKDQEIELNSGDICNVDASSALDGLRDHTDSGAVVDVWICYGAKEKIKGGRTYWPAEVKVAIIKPGRTTPF